MEQNVDKFKKCGYSNGDKLILTDYNMFDLLWYDNKSRILFA